MLYNPKWVDPQWLKPSLEGFRAYLRSRNPDDSYEWSDGFRCAAYQYAIAFGWREDWHNRRAVWQQLDLLAHQLPHTFGALADRVEEEIKG